MNDLPKLAIIGAGKVGQTLGRLWHERRVFEIGDVLNRRLDNARAAVAFVGAGRPTNDWGRLTPADVYMLSVPDDAIEVCAHKLAQTGVVGTGSIVLHCSGSKSSSVLGPLEIAGARVASMHPVKSFADPSQASVSFAGTHCALEGHRSACAVLKDAVEQCGGLTFEIGAEAKLLYHAATVFASNYVVALAEVALRCFEQAGVPRAQGLSIALPLLRGTVENISKLGTADALTGPISRGDDAIVGAQHRELAKHDAELAKLYASLGRYAVELAAEKGGADRSSLQRIAQELTDGH